MGRQWRRQAHKYDKKYQLVCLEGVAACFVQCLQRLWRKLREEALIDRSVVDDIYACL
jgi:hypothetical protein